MAPKKTDEECGKESATSDCCRMENENSFTVSRGQNSVRGRELRWNFE
jgi:hypothetical protein